MAWRDHKRDLHHTFSIWLLGRRPGFFQPQRYVYRCIRCKWAFLVNEPRRGRVLALDEHDARLEGGEAERRLATFADGPCPALNQVAAALEQNGKVASVDRRDILRSLPGGRDHAA